jgi:hypothetical protein
MGSSMNTTKTMNPRPQPTKPLMKTRFTPPHQLAAFNFRISTLDAPPILLYEGYQVLVSLYCSTFQMSLACFLKIFMPWYYLTGRFCNTLDTVVHLKTMPLTPCKGCAHVFLFLCFCEFEHINQSYSA